MAQRATGIVAALPENAASEGHVVAALADVSGDGGRRRLYLLPGGSGRSAPVALTVPGAQPGDQLAGR